MTEQAPSATRFLNRELSWLEFNWRVLALAQDAATPLLDRVRFLAICASNLDEFFMKRVGGLRRQMEAGVSAPTRDGVTPQQQIEMVREVVQRMNEAQRSLFFETLIPALRERGINVATYAGLTPEQRAQADEYFTHVLFPVLTPLGVGPGHPFPFLSNLSLSIAVRLKLPEEDERHFARVKVPANRPRFLRLDNDAVFVPIEDIILAHISRLFPGAEIIEAAPFVVTRNANVEHDEEEAEDLIEMIHEELRGRKFAPLVRLKVGKGASQDMQTYLAGELSLGRQDIFAVDGMLRLSDLHEIASLERPDLHDAPWAPVPHPAFRSAERGEERPIFDVLNEGDVLVHHPFQSFNSSVLRLLEEAAEDPRVVAIKQTLYRTAPNSPIVKALVKACENGKQVAVLVEIRARFDEANNLKWVKELEEVGCHVTYGLIGLKTHCKALMVARDGPDGVRLYCHFGTGNYHTGTARAYTDVGLFISDGRYDKDLTQLFNMLTGFSANPVFEHLMVAPVNMREQFLWLINNEAECAKAGKPARIIAKMNQLEDTDIIEALYAASQAGVSIDLIVRGLCCIVPGVAGMSENIRVRSIVGRFLEHSRIYHFQNGGEYEYLIGSADWMRRNLEFRVETLVPVTHAAAKEELGVIFATGLADNTNAWTLNADGSYVRVAAAEGQQAFSFQAAMMNRAQDKLREADLKKSVQTSRFRPIRGSHVRDTGKPSA